MLSRRVDPKSESGRTGTHAVSQKRATVFKRACDKQETRQARHASLQKTA
jgi:hypothetical protein